MTSLRQDEALFYIVSDPQFKLELDRNTNYFISLNLCHLDLIVHCKRHWQAKIMVNSAYDYLMKLSNSKIGKILLIRLRAGSHEGLF